MIDVLDRADGENAFGDLLTVMPGHQVAIPCQIAGSPVRVLPPHGTRDTGIRPGEFGAYVVMYQKLDRGVSGRLAMVEAQKSAEALPADDRSRLVEVGGRQDELTAQI